MIFIKPFLKNFLNFLRNVRLLDNITNFYYEIVQCYLVLNKIFEKNHIDFAISKFLKKLVKVGGVTFPKQVLEPYSSFVPAVFGKTKSCCST